VTRQDFSGYCQVSLKVAVASSPLLEGPVIGRGLSLLRFDVLRAQQKITAVAAKDRWEPDPVRSPQQARRAVDTSDVWRAAPRALGVLVLLVLVIVASRMMMDDPQSPQGVSRAAVLTAPQAPDISGWRGAAASHNAGDLASSTGHGGSSTAGPAGNAGG
jgi:hypothetical protein